jgi:hypothetical protein
MLSRKVTTSGILLDLYAPFGVEQVEIAVSGIFKET